MQILCAVSQKAQLLEDPLPGLRPWTPLGDFRLPGPQSSFMSPNNPVRSTPLGTEPEIHLWAIYPPPNCNVRFKKYHCNTRVKEFFRVLVQQ